MSIRAKAKFFRLLDGQSVRINKVFNPYLSGGLEVNGKFIGKTYKYFPKRLTEDVVISGDENAKYQEGDENAMELREQIWNKEAKVFEFHKVKEKLDRDFFSTYKKVFDIELVAAKGIKVGVWNSALSKEEDVNTENEPIMFQAIAASKVRQMIEGLDLDAGIQMVNGKDKAGNPALVKPFDWEDEFKFKLEGKFVKVRVRGTGMDTKYTFVEGDEFTVPEEATVKKVEDKRFEENEIPFR